MSSIFMLNIYDLYCIVMLICFDAWDGIGVEILRMSFSQNCLALTIDDY